ncbi:MAG: MBL fold metallo-hydrolase [Clostridia bacterium]|nr:MBL fold metallo-hydrolase [Clostridia bacterium]
MGKNAIHMLKSVTDTIGNSFIITTEDGKLIVIDGGFPSETDYFKEYLKQTAGTGKPHIDAWFLSHPHDDHATVFFEMIEKHRDEFDVDRVYLNFPSREYLAAEDKSAAETMDLFYRTLPLFADKMRIVSGGDVLDVGAAKFYILYSPDPEFRHNRANNSSIIFRMELGGKSVMFTGDAGIEAGNKVLRLYGDSGLLKCDFCQMAHHGQNGCDRPFYEAVAPEVCLWPTPSWVWSNVNGTGSLQTLVVRRWMEELGVKQNYVSKDGTQVIEL